MSGGHKRASDADPILGSKPKLSKMRELEPGTEAFSEATDGRGTGLTVCCSIPAWIGMSFLTQGDFWIHPSTPDFL
jgi:hypothetical protein